ncbi:hypothetical protein [Maribacter antarcticus]|uniref:hypothetical protein n=1 Tax=Maribacter antarcticus TaxID=505250 RepID=UPI000B2E69F5|nr:hypothetical protein [Maribacter antarcticus]
MKKYIVVGLMVIGTIFSATANETVSAVINEVAIFSTEEFKKVTSKELTPKVIEQLLKEYPTSKLGGVYKNSKGEFKLIMVLQSGTRRTVYIDYNGNWLNKK